MFLNVIDLYVLVPNPGLPCGKYSANRLFILEAIARHPPRLSSLEGWTRPPTRWLGLPSAAVAKLRRVGNEELGPMIVYSKLQMVPVRQSHAQSPSLEWQ